ncbi:CpaF family protein [Thermoflexus sp.]|uniref:CpaF family protein n=1 Tax=Thermoflexus sp. TaxID=1969742 RepID=UPI0025D45E34|nr:CpaF family protein [Thermoflexus sp.]MDW8180469.1 CpaF family protein [Anaerolineae bacterium]MCS6963056.1 CpaF family protein [Thermoflexus sp.]MCS7351017.1 CpaF family protein [Thermoflexus sp.]MCX7691246.1 CpaF family protein [Thermoflexus sp.]MDW8184807.1 CpaF family protein [Anaerolineae bacterium]
MAIWERLEAVQRGDGQHAGERASLRALAYHYRRRLMEEGDLESLLRLPRPILRARLEALLAQMIREEGEVLSPSLQTEIVNLIVDETIGLGPLEPLLRDPAISEIMVNWRARPGEEGHAEVFVERFGRIERREEVEFEGREHLLHIIDRILSPLGRRLDESNPRVDARLADGSRVAAAIPPIAVDGPVLSIRRFRERAFTMEDLIANGTLTETMAAFLRAAVRARLNILVSGGTGSGKTTLLNVLAGFIPHDQRVITIEDIAELRFYEQHPHAVRFEARPPNVEGKGEITIRDLVRLSLRMRPDRIVVGEVRGGEALDMLQAMNTGHEGSMTTVHANSPQEAFSRLETMVMWAEAAQQLSLRAIREQLATIDLVVQMMRLSGGERKVVAITEVQGLKGEQLLLKDLFVYHQLGVDELGRAYGYFTPTGVRPRCLGRMRRWVGPAEVDRLEAAMRVNPLEGRLPADILKDPSVSEIMINGPKTVFIERRGQLEPVPLDRLNIRDELQLMEMAAMMAAHAGRRIDEKRPLVDARLPDGSRVNIVLPPLALNGPVITIRRFRKELVQPEDLIRRAAFERRMAIFLRKAVQARLNILVIGGTGSGKTTLLNLLASYIPDEERLITIEDTAELRLNKPHWVRLETRTADEFGEGEVTIRDLVINALRMRPDRIIVGEVRGGEALDMIQAINTGHQGSMTTLHANSPEDAFARLETMLRMAREGADLPEAALRRLICAFNLVVQTARLIDGTRKVIRIDEVVGVQGDLIRTEPIYAFQPMGTAEDSETVRGYFAATGYRPAVSLRQMEEHGVSWTPDLFDPGPRIWVEGERWIRAPEDGEGMADGEASLDLSE